MPDLLIYRESAKLEPNRGNYTYQVCGTSCLAGDIFGEFRFEKTFTDRRLSFVSGRSWLYDGQEKAGLTA